MPETTVSAELLSDLIEGRSFAYGESSAEAELARLARACRELAVPGASPETTSRLVHRLERLLDGPRWLWWQGWFGGVTRPLAQRMAAGALVLAAAGGGTSAAAGVPPQEFAADAAGLAHSIVVNLGPGGNSGGSPTPEPSSTPPPSATQTPSSTPPATAPLAQPTQGASATPDPDPEDDDDETRTPEPGDDDGGDRDDNSGDDDDETPDTDDSSGRGGGS